MNILARLTAKQIRADRGRFAVTVLGVALATLMLSAVLLGFDAVERALYAWTAAQSGAYHWQAANLSAEEAGRLLAEPGFGAGAVMTAGAGAVNDATGAQTTLYGATDGAWSIFAVDLADGALPAASGDLLIGQGMAEEWGLSVGDTVPLRTGSRNITWRVCGIYRSVAAFAPPENGRKDTLQEYVSFYRLDAGNLPAEGRDAASYQFYAAAQTPDAAFFERCDALEAALAGDGGTANAWYNENLLAFTDAPVRGRTQNNFWPMAAAVRNFMLAVIAVGAAIMIVNAFSIGVAERSRDLGLLAGAGATRAQKMLCVYYEAAAVGALGIPLGLLAACGGLGLAFALCRVLLADTALAAVAQRLTLTVRVPVLAAALLSSLAVVAVSAWIPARRAGRASVIEAIRGEGTVRLGKPPRAGLFGRIFGPEGQLAQKNAKRSRGRYRATVASLTLSVVLLISLSGLMLYLERGFGLGRSEQTYDVKAILQTDDEADPTDTDLWRRLTAPVTPMAFTWTEEVTWGNVTVPAGKMGDGQPEQQMLLRVMVLPDDRFAALAGADAAGSGDTLDALVANHAVYHDDSGYYERADITNFAAGDTLAWDFNAMPVTLNIVGTTNDYVETISPTHLILLTSRSAIQTVFDAWYARNAGIDPADRSCRRTLTVYYTTDAPEALTAELAALGQSGPAGVWVSVENETARKAQLAAMFLLVRLVLYGFAALVALLCGANIANTVSTALTLRRKEFAMLRSCGMTPEGLRKMVLLESGVYAIKALGIGLPVSGVLLGCEYALVHRQYRFLFTLPWGAILAAVLGVALLTAAVSLPALRRLQTQELVEELRNN